jgi:hypothetical protein
MPLLQQHHLILHQVLLISHGQYVRVRSHDQQIYKIPANFNVATLKLTKSVIFENGNRLLPDF